MSLEFPGIINLLQIQVTTMDFVSWIHCWTLPLSYENIIKQKIYINILKHNVIVTSTYIKAKFGYNKDSCSIAMNKTQL